MDRFLCQDDKKIESLIRKHVRWATMLNVKIKCGPRNFECLTKDISLGGFCLLQSLPESFAGYMTVEISIPNTDEVFEMICSPVENQSKGIRRFQFQPPLFLNGLREHFVSGISNSCIRQKDLQEAYNASQNQLSQEYNKIKSNCISLEVEIADDTAPIFDLKTIERENPD